MKCSTIGIASIGFWALAGAAQASTVTLDFDAFRQGEDIGSFYTGGHGSLGTGPGPDLGITFHSLNNVGVPVGCQTPCLLGQDNSKIGKALEITPAGLQIHTPLGFSGTVEFDAALQSGRKALFDIQTSNQIIDPPPPIEGPVIDNSTQNPPGCALQQCGFVHYSLTMDPGVIGRTLDFFTFFTGMSGDFLFIDNLHFSDLTLPGTPHAAVPEPASWMLMTAGGVGLGLTLRRRRAVAA